VDQNSSQRSRTYESYRFTIFNKDDHVEELGSISLAGDHDALAFGELERPPGRAVAIITGQRIVQSIPLE